MLHSLLLLSLLSALIPGCASVALAPDIADRSAKQFSAEPDRGNLYVVRAGGLAGSADVCQIAIDDKVVGGLGPSTFHLASLRAGLHTVTVSGVENAESRNVLVEAGANHFIRVEAAWGWRWRWTTSTLNSDDGRKMVAGAKLARGLRASEPTP